VSLRILSYNVRYFGHGTGGLASTRKAMRRIAAAVAALDPLPSIVCLQEVETRSIRSTLAHPGEETQLERFMTMLSAELTAAGKSDAYQAYYFPAHAYRIAPNTHFYTTGLAILAHEDFEVDHHNAGTPQDITHRRLHAVQGRGLKQTRICAHVRFREKKARTHRAIEIFNTHLSLPSAIAREFWTQPKRLGWGKNQLEEAKNLARFVERERASDSFAVVGDFNALPGSPVYEYLVRERGWVDAFAQRYRFTTTELAEWPTAGFFRMRMHLDHVFAGPGLRFVDFDGTHPYGTRSAPFHGLSDHVPMLARCRLPKGDGSSMRPPPQGKP
jgi:endonuclease/exonuclease/phosphatase family metal-dependent hydrolase